MGASGETGGGARPRASRLRAWLALAAFAIALAASAAVQWEWYGGGYVDQLPLLMGAAALCGALAWGISAWAGCRSRRRQADDAALPFAALVSPAVVAACLAVVAGLVLLYRNPLSSIGTALWAAGIAALPAAIAWREKGAGPRLAARIDWRRAAAVAALLTVALALRVYRLEELPTKYLDDEGATADFGLNYLHGEPFYGQHVAAPNTLFRLGTTAYPLLGSYVHALVMQVAGETVFGSRLTAAIAGVLCVAVLLALLREHVSLPAAYAAATLFAFCHTHLYWSRAGIAQSMTTTAIAAVLWLTLRGLRSGRYATFCTAGVLLGLAQQFYEGARFFVPVIAVFFAVAALADPGLVRRRWRHALVMASASALVFAPIGFWYLEYPHELLARSRGVLIFAQPDYLASRYPGLDTAGIVLAQLRRALEGFAFRGDGSDFYALRAPILDPTARILVLTGVLAVFAMRDRLRLMVVLWIWIPIAIVCVPTVDPPSMTRLILVLPALYVLAALVLDRIFAVGEAAAGRIGRGVLILAAVAAVVYGGRWDLLNFFDRYPREALAGPQTVAGLAIREHAGDAKTFILGEAYSFHAPAVRFLARGHLGENLPADAVPIRERGRRDGFLLVAANDAAALERVRAAYPSARETPYADTRGAPLFHTFEIAAADLNAAADPLAPWATADVEFGARGTGDGEFSFAQALAVDRRGFVYVADTANRRIVVFDRQGDFVRTFGADGAGAVGNVVDLAILADGTVLALARDPSSLRRYGADGDWLEDIALEPPIAAPAGLALAPDGFYVLDAGRSRLARFRLDGTLVARVEGLAQPAAIASGADGRVYVFERGRGAMRRFSPTLEGEAEWPLPLSVDRLGGILAVGPPGDERVLVASPTAGEVLRFDRDGTPTFSIGRRGDHRGQLAWPVAVAVGDGGDVFVYDDNRARIYRYDLSAATATTSLPAAPPGSGADAGDEARLD